MQIVTELKTRGISDIFIACVDGLKGLPEAIEAVFSATQVQLCLVHPLRNSLAFVSHKDRKAVADDLKSDVWGKPTLRPAATGGEGAVPPPCRAPSELRLPHPAI